MDLKRDITRVTDVKRGGTNINYIYRATTLIWQRTVPTIGNRYYTKGFSIVFNNNNAGSNIYITSGINIKLK